MMAVTTDAFTMNWQEFRGYANPNKESTGTGTPITSRACTCGSSMESTRVVPHIIEHANTHTAPNPPEVEPIQTTYPEILPEVTPTLVSYKVCKISEGATKLLMRQNSSKAYDFGKWVSWCSRHDSDPDLCRWSTSWPTSLNRAINIGQ